MKTYPTWVDDGSPIADPFGYGERAVRFLRNLKHPKSRARGQAFQLDPWVERIVRRVYGPRHEADIVENGIVTARKGERIVKTVFCMIPRGNRKTSALGAPLALLHTIGPEKTQNGQVICAASDQKQAKIALNEALSVVNCDRRLSGKVRDLAYQNKIVGTDTNTVLEAISADAKTQHGRTPDFTLMDEIHAWPKRDLWEALKTGLLKTPGSLNVIITTAGRGQNNIAFEQYDYARRVAIGEIIDPATLPVIFEAPKDCDWQDEDVWRHVNPGLAHGYPDIVGLRQFARESAARPADRESFRQLNLNIWLDHSQTPFVDMETYDQGAEPIDFDALKGRPCWLGVDLSSNRDLTVIVAAWRDDHDGFIVRSWFFCPRDNLSARSDNDRVPYPQWADEGLITPTPGNVVDFRAVEAIIRELCETYEVREIAFDPYLARNTMNNLLEDGYPAVEMRQGWITMAPAIAELERAIIGGNFRHGGNPILRWHFDNVAVETDKSGNKSFHKGKSRDRIDGAVACAMAVARAAAGDSGTSIYDDLSARPEGLLIF